MKKVSNFIYPQPSPDLKQDALVKPSAMLYVVAPSYLGFVVLPDKKWVLGTEKVYTILIELYDKNSHKIYPSDVSSVP